ncbi:MAG: FtsX-like permease family protein, partial [Pseudohongiellaceae bacterium]
FNVVVSLFMIVRNKQGDIAILRTMGSSIGTIRNIFLLQGLIIGVIGTGIGLIAGLLLSLSITDISIWLESLLGIDFITDTYPVNFLPSQIQFQDVFLVCSASIVLCLLATLYPAFSAAKVRPAEALRFE